MAYIFMDDGGPEANEYANNYLYFDGTNSRTIEKIVDILSYSDTRDPAVRKRLKNICQSRPDAKPERNRNQVGISQIDDVPRKRNIFSQQTRRLTNLFLRRNELVDRRSGCQQSTYGTALEM